MYYISDDTVSCCSVDFTAELSAMISFFNWDFVMPPNRMYMYGVSRRYNGSRPQSVTNRTSPENDNVRLGRRLHRRSVNSSQNKQATVW